jgi:peptidoglycan/LPS O-acetylase OafA/YrhL
MPQLDALRFFAVLGVLISHFWIPQELPWLFADIDLGWLGVRLFFVLSGFLITGILLDARWLTETSPISPAYLIRQFYIRRFLRIFPIYYLVIAIALIFNVTLGRELWGWLVSYTSNIYITVHNTWMGVFSHFWSLAVEEQFYLLWPCLILFLPKKWIPAAITVVILLAPAYRFWAYQTYRLEISPFDFKAGTFTLASLDSLGLGALLSYAWRNKLVLPAIQKYLTALVLPFGVLLYVASLALYHYRIKPSVFFTLNDLAASLIFTWLVGSASLGFKGLKGKFLNFPVFSYLGKISYGIYIYHYFTPLILVSVLSRFGYELRVPGLTNFILSSLFTIIVASLSWHWLELPINNLKRYFQYTAVPTIHVPESGQTAAMEK